MHILVVDDCALTREFIETCLRRAGHDVRTAPHGLIGSRILANQTFDLIVTDIFMPETDGLELLLQIRSLACETPVLVISGGGQSLDQDYLGAASKLGASAVLAKPIAAQDLVRVVASLYQAAWP